MTIKDIATVRTGLVTTRKKHDYMSCHTYKYQLLSLGCITNEGNIDSNYLEPYEVSEKLKIDYLTHMKDILVRLSAPYTSVIINKKELCGIVIPSHFAIIRIDKRYAVPEYVLWSMKQNKNRVMMMRNSSGSTSFGTISSGLISTLPITLLPFEKQKIIGNIMLLSEYEQELLQKLRVEKKKYSVLLMSQIYDNMKGKNIK